MEGRIDKKIFLVLRHARGVDMGEYTTWTYVHRQPLSRRKQGKKAFLPPNNSNEFSDRFPEKRVRPDGRKRKKV